MASGFAQADQASRDLTRLVEHEAALTRGTNDLPLAPSKGPFKGAFKGAFRGGEIKTKSGILDFWHFCGKTNFIKRFLRIHPVQKVLDNPTQLSGRGFPRISHMEPFSSQLYVFWYSKMEAEPCNSKIRKFEICFFWKFEIFKFEILKFENLKFWNSKIWKIEIWNLKI